MSIQKQKAFEKNLIKYITEWIESESSPSSLITVTNCNIDKKYKNAIIFTSIFPEDKEHGALTFLNRKSKAVQKYIIQKMRGKMIPKIEFVIDKGEKNRQRIDELLKEV